MHPVFVGSCIVSISSDCKHFAPANLILHNQFRALTKENVIPVNGYYLSHLGDGVPEEAVDPDRKILSRFVDV